MRLNCNSILVGQSCETVWPKPPNGLSNYPHQTISNWFLFWPAICSSMVIEVPVQIEILVHCIQNWAVKMRTGKNTLYSENSHSKTSGFDIFWLIYLQKQSRTFFKYTSDFFQYYFIFIDHAAHLSDLPICRLLDFPGFHTGSFSDPFRITDNLILILKEGNV